MEDWPEPVERVAAALRDAGVDARLEEFSDGTATAAAAAAALGCDVDQIVKSLVFICDGRPVLALVPGDRRADPDKVAAAASSRYARVASLDEVRAATGFDPGAVAPLPSSDSTRVVIDRDLLRHPTVWAGAGSVHHVVGLSPLDIVRLTRAELADLGEG